MSAHLNAQSGNAIRGQSFCSPEMRAGSRRHCSCFTPDIPPLRPDPAIYSQELIFNSGKIPTWDSPDIFAPFYKLSGDINTVSVTVHNRSSQVSAVNTVVSISVAQFGIGMPRVAIPPLTLTIPPASSCVVKGVLPDDVQYRSDVAFDVRIFHPHDVDISNNRGARNVMIHSIYDSTKPITSTLQVRNPTNSPLKFSLAIHSSDGVLTDFSTNHFTLNPLEVVPIKIFFFVPPAVLATLMGTTLHTPVIPTTSITVLATDPSDSLIDGATIILRGPVL
ncbi:hypothetical protein [Paraburkholderia unamae]|uniref:Uncharacterized protein n=1 Tax=Paraburkholderia unamae TaxID=219649 RepID=A0ACC6RX86_9BURK